MEAQSSQQALAQLQEAQRAAQNPTDILGAQRQQLGVGGAQETVKGLRGAIDSTTKLLKQVAPSVMGRTQSSLVTQAQATRQIANERAPIAERLTEQGGQLTESQQDLAELQRQASEAAQGIYQGQQDRQSYLQNLYNTLYQREEAEKERQRQEAERQEQIRQFNEDMALQRAKLNDSMNQYRMALGSSQASQASRANEVSALYKANQLREQQLAQLMRAGASKVATSQPVKALRGLLGRYF